MKRWITPILFSLFLLTIIYYVNQDSRPAIFQLVYIVPFGDKIMHFVLIGTLSFVVNIALQGRIITVNGYQLLLGSVMIATIATAEEFSQLWFPMRTFSLADLMFNYFGIYFFGYIVRRIFHASEKDHALPTPSHSL